MSLEKSKTFNYEKSLKELEKLVEQLEAGDLPLESALKHFEKGITLTRLCQTALSQAKQKVEQLIEKNGELHLSLFEENDDEEQA